MSGPVSRSQDGGDDRLISRRHALALCGGAAACAFGGGLAFERVASGAAGSSLDRLLGRHHRTTNNLRRLAADPDGVFGVDTKQKVVALSFDDGPDTRYTPSVLEILAAHRSHATFFEVGMNALAHPHLVLAVQAAGHSIGNHTRSHQQLDRLTAEAAFEEILEGAADLKRAGAPSTHLLRPPFGYIDDVVGAFVDAHHLRSVFWSSCVEHQLKAKVADPVAQMVAEVVPGDIILAHDGSGLVHVPERHRTNRAATVAALPRLLAGLADRGFSVVDVPRLLECGTPRRASSPGF